MTGYTRLFSLRKFFEKKTTMKISNTQKNSKKISKPFFSLL